MNLSLNRKREPLFKHRTGDFQGKVRKKRNLLRNAEGRSGDVRNSEVVGDERVRRERHAGEKSKAEEEHRTSRRHKVRFFLLRIRDHKAYGFDIIIIWVNRNGREDEAMCLSVSVGFWISSYKTLENERHLTFLSFFFLFCLIFRNKVCFFSSFFSHKFTQKKKSFAFKQFWKKHSYFCIYPYVPVYFFGVSLSLN